MIYSPFFLLLPGFRDALCAYLEPAPSHPDRARRWTALLVGVAETQQPPQIPRPSPR